MNAVMLTSYPRTLTVVAALLTLLMLAYGGAKEGGFLPLSGVIEGVGTISVWGVGENQGGGVVVF